MYKAFCLLISFLFSLSILNAQSFEINGKIDNAPNKILYISYYSTYLNKGVTDTCSINDKQFVFKGRISMPTLATIRLVNNRSFENVAIIFIEPGIMNLYLNADSMSNAVLAGSGAQREYDTLKSLQNELYSKYKSVLDSIKLLSAGNESEQLQKREQEYYQKYWNLDSTFMLSHPQSIVTAFFLPPYFRKMDKEGIIDYYKNMGENLQSSIYGTQVADYIEKLSRASIGDSYTDFERTDVNNKQIALHQFKGKYILLDFWASWCVPCREENPHMIKLFKKYNEKGLEIISIADDDDHVNKWKEAINKDGTGIWYHVLRGSNKEKAMNGIFNPIDLNNLYGVRVLPTKILIDTEGKIIYNSSRKNDYDLDEMLKNIFGY